MSTVATLVKSQWHLPTTETSWVAGAAILGAVCGAFVFGRLADIFERKTVYVTVASVMVVGSRLRPRPLGRVAYCGPRCSRSRSRGRLSRLVGAHE
jgi:MFS family permease